MIPAPQALDDTLAALADPTRRRVIDRLRERPWRAGELAVEFGVSAPGMSKHLKVLRASRLVEEAIGAPDARVRLYRLRPEPFDGLIDWLEQVRQFWGDQLAAFQAHADRDKP